jgi:hypothetical protein
MQLVIIFIALLIVFGLIFRFVFPVLGKTHDAVMRSRGRSGCLLQGMWEGCLFPALVALIAMLGVAVVVFLLGLLGRPR